MKEGACFICKKKGHLSHQCLERQKKSLNIRSMMEGLTEEQKQDAIALIKEGKAKVSRDIFKGLKGDLWLLIQD